MLQTGSWEASSGSGHAVDQAAFSTARERRNASPPKRVTSAGNAVAADSNGGGGGGGGGGGAAAAATLESPRALSGHSGDKTPTTRRKENNSRSGITNSGSAVGDGDRRGSDGGGGGGGGGGDATPTTTRKASSKSGAGNGSSDGGVGGGTAISVRYHSDIALHGNNGDFATSFDVDKGTDSDDSFEILDMPVGAGDGSDGSEYQYHDNNDATAPSGKAHRNVTDEDDRRVPTLPRPFPPTPVPTNHSL